MALYPRSIVGRGVAIIWILACVLMLVFAWVQQSIHDMPEAFIWLMIFLTFPIGYVVAFVVGVIASVLSSSATYHPFWDLVPMWLALTVAGYVQWFVFVPFAWRRLRASKRAI